VIAILSDGRRKGFDLSSRCRAVRIPNVPSNVSAAVNVLTSDSELIVVGDNQDVVEKAFNVKLSQNRASLPGVVSRKKQVVPQLTNAFEA